MIIIIIDYGVNDNRLYGAVKGNILILETGKIKYKILKVKYTFDNELAMLYKFEYNTCNLIKVFKC